VVYGYMPAKTTIFNQRAVATHTFQLGPRNTILFSPHGRFVLVAGFGNLAGQMDIYDLEKDYTKVVTIDGSNASVCEWSPDGKHILTATTSPRLRVDNGVKIWHVGGGMMYFEEMTELYHVCWRPQSTVTHPLESPLNPAPTPHESALNYLAKAKTPSKPAGAYRPPGARGTSTPLHFKREDEGGAAYVNNGISSTGPSTNGFGGAFGNGFGPGKGRRHVPGAEGVEQTFVPAGAAPGGGVSLVGTGEGVDGEMSKAALKNKKKREAKKAKEAAEKAAGLHPDGEGVPGPEKSPERTDRFGHQRSRSRGTNGTPRGASRPRGASQHRKEGPNMPTVRLPPGLSVPALAPSAPAITPPDVTVTSPGGASGQDKKVRSLLKKIRAIEDLKMRQANGEKLEDTQVKKIATEEVIRKDLESLGFHA